MSSGNQHPDKSRHQLSQWRNKLAAQAADPKAGQLVALSHEREHLAQLFYAENTHPSYQAYTQFSEKVRQSLESSPCDPKLLNALYAAEDKAGHFIASRLWKGLENKMRGKPGEVSETDLVEYAKAGLDPSQLLPHQKAIIVSGHPYLVDLLAGIVEPNNLETFRLLLQGSPYAAQKILPLLTQLPDQPVPISPIEVDHLSYLPNLVPAEIKTSLAQACAATLLRSHAPENVLRSTEKYLGISPQELLQIAAKNLYKINPTLSHLSLLRPYLEGNTKRLNKIIADCADKKEPLPPQWEEFIVKNPDPYLLLPLLFLHSPRCWELAKKHIRPPLLRENLQNTLLYSLTYPVKVASWTVVNQMLDFVGKSYCKADPLTLAMQTGKVSSLVFPANSEEGLLSLIRQGMPHNLLHKFSDLHTIPSRAVRNELLFAGLRSKNQSLVKLGRKTKTAEKQFVNTSVTNCTPAVDLLWYAEALPRLAGTVLHTYLDRIISNQSIDRLAQKVETPTREHLEALDKLATRVIQQAKHPKEETLLKLTQANLIQHIPSCRQLISHQTSLVTHARTWNLHYLLENGAHLGQIKPDLTILLRYQNTAIVLPLLIKFGITLDDGEFSQVVEQTNRNLTLLPLVESLLKLNPRRQLDNEILGELVESPLLALLIRFGLLKITDSIDGMPLTDMLDDEELIDLVPNYQGQDSKSLLQVAEKNPQLAWDILKRSVQVSHAKTNLTPHINLDVELF